MSQAYFFDTSVLVKLYHDEAGTERVEAIFNQLDSPLVISELATVEFYAALARRVRMGEITVQAQDEARRNFADDCVQRFVIDPLGSPVMQKARELLHRYGNTYQSPTYARCPATRSMSHGAITWGSRVCLCRYLAWRDWHTRRSDSIKP